MALTEALLEEVRLIGIDLNALCGLILLEVAGRNQRVGLSIVLDGHIGRGLSSRNAAAGIGQAALESQMLHTALLSQVRAFRLVTIAAASSSSTMASKSKWIT